MEARVIKGFSLKLKMKNVLKYLGLSLWVQQNNPKRASRYRKKVKAIYEEVRHLIYPRAIYQTFDYEILSRKRMVLFNPHTGCQDKLSSFYLVKKNILRFKPERVVLFVATFGDEILKNADAQDFDRLFYLNAIGSEGAEAVARYVCKLLAGDYGYQRSFRRLSPGYGEVTGFDWEISQQRVIFNLLGRKKIKEELAVELLNSSESASFLMVPLKTVSGIAFPYFKEVV
jgi:hypothetical protein